MSRIFEYLGKLPDISSATFVAPGSQIIGDVKLEEGVSIWYNCVLRGDVNYIRIGRYTNIQDNSVVHADSGRSGVSSDNGRVGGSVPNGLPTVIGSCVTVGHGCILHACTIEDDCLIGMGSTLLDGVKIGRGSIIGAGTVITKGTVIPPFSVVVGTPGKVVKTLDESSISERRAQAQHYCQLAIENNHGCMRGE